MIKAVIFDMDGLMFDTERLAAKALIEAANEQGIDMNFEETQLSLGYTRNAMYDLYKEYYKDIKDVDTGKMVDRGYEIMEEVLFSAGPEKMPFIEELLVYLRENNYKIAVASSSDIVHIENNLEKTNLRGFIDIVASGEEVENSKPEPDVFLLAAKRLGVEAKNCVVLEDSKFGIMAANSADMASIMIPDTFSPDEITKKLSYKIVGNLWDVVSILENELNV